VKGEKLLKDSYFPKVETSKFICSIFQTCYKRCKRL